MTAIDGCKVESKLFEGFDGLIGSEGVFESCHEDVFRHDSHSYWIVVDVYKVLTLCYGLTYTREELVVLVLTQQQHHRTIC